MPDEPQVCACLLLLDSLAHRVLPCHIQKESETARLQHHSLACCMVCSATMNGEALTMLAAVLMLCLLYVQAMLEQHSN